MQLNTVLWASLSPEKMHSFEEYQGFLEVAFAIHPCYTVFFGLTVPATALGVLVNCFGES
jgi:hypothetical protein